jgi:hypothetical protein
MLTCDADQVLPQACASRAHTLLNGALVDAQKTPVPERTQNSFRRD